MLVLQVVNLINLRLKDRTKSFILSFHLVKSKITYMKHIYYTLTVPNQKIKIVLF